MAWRLVYGQPSKVVTARTRAGLSNPAVQVGESDDGGQHRHYPRVPERQSGGVLTVNLRRSGHLGEGGHIRSGSGIGGLRVAQTLVGVLANRP